MNEAKSQVARRALVSIVSTSDKTVVTRNALENSEEFRSFLDKKIIGLSFKEMDYVDVLYELEDILKIDIDDQPFCTWGDLFKELTKLMEKQ